MTFQDILAKYRAVSLQTEPPMQVQCDNDRHR